MEPERPIEKLLRSYAKKRREEPGAPSEVHPATRRLLQGEVGRELRGKHTAEPEPGPLRLWMRLGWALGVLVVLGVAVSLLVPEINHSKPHAAVAENGGTSGPAPAGNLAYLRPESSADKENARGLEAATEVAREKSKIDLADRDSAPRPEQSKAQAPEMASAPSQTLGREQNEPAATASLAAPRAKLESDAAGNRKLTAESRIAATSPAAPAVAGESNLLTQQRRDSLLREEVRVAVNGEAQQANSNVLAFGLAGGAKAATDALAASFKDAATLTQTQLFRQVGDAPQITRSYLDKKAEPAGRVLTAFQVEQSGREVRVIDSDGSLYTGFIQPPQPAFHIAAAIDAPTNTAKEAEDRGVPAVAPPPAIIFVVTGTNQTLKLPVVFSGKIEQTTTVAGVNQSPITNAVTGGALGGVRLRVGRSLPLANSRISGTASVGSDKVIPVEAVPAEK